MEILIICFGVIIVVLLVVVIFLLLKNNNDEVRMHINKEMSELNLKISQIENNLLVKLTKDNYENFEKILRQNNTNMQESKDLLNSIKVENTNAQLTLAKSLKESLTEIRKMNEDKLNEINKAVSDKLDKSLNERLDSSFKQIGERLGDLYKSLGELNKLSSGVTDLNKTLSNVKSRGIWGEIQLKNIFEDIMTSNQYEENFITKKGSNERVEFAVKIPSKTDDKEFIYLPIDSKFPLDVYNKIVIASNNFDKENMVAATKELEQRIKAEAKSIKDKYLDVPNTTDFAVMFLPTESLYSEVLRIDGLNEFCQKNYKVIISGPTTITALLNSLRVGFSNLTLSKKTEEIIKILQNVKSQYQNLNELIDKTQKKLSEAMTSTEKLKDRTRIIQNKMAKIELPEENGDKLLNIEE